ncbi:MAG: low molecular weight phosphotyrosine protein phosphatase [Gammaproteobacteria bacterium]|nr:low molecular weight phosphotyrosine protein phosphatase [Gammaproteobacteria bacterium]
MAESRTGILFVCMGNICRSPTAEGVMRKLLQDRALAHAFELDSAGTHAYHVGEPPDDRAIAAARRRGIDLSDQRARRVEVADFERFDYVLAMDADNLQRLRDMQPESCRADVRLLLDFSTEDPGGAVPDPYYGGAAGFERVLDLLEEANQALIERLIVKS